MQKLTIDRPPSFIVMIEEGFHEREMFLTFPHESGKLPAIKCKCHAWPGAGSSADI
jgi:hypothetical protein